jgi:hypothetical protein
LEIRVYGLTATGIDWGFQQWHSDGTEITNSGGQLPATGNFSTGSGNKPAAVPSG